MTTGKRETVSLIGSDKVEGTAVYGADDRKIGTVQDYQVDPAAGRLAALDIGGGENDVRGFDIRASSPYTFIPNNILFNLTNPDGSGVQHPELLRGPLSLRCPDLGRETGQTLPTQRLGEPVESDRLPGRLQSLHDGRDHLHGRVLVDLRSRPVGERAGQLALDCGRVAGEGVVAETAGAVRVDEVGDALGELHLLGAGVAHLVRDTDLLVPVREQPEREVELLPERLVGAGVVEGSAEYDDLVGFVV